MCLVYTLVLKFGERVITPDAMPSLGGIFVEIIQLRCCAQDLFKSQTPVTTGEFKLQIFCT